MTISEMHTAVKLGLDKSSALELPAFEPEEIDFWLNKSILQFVKTRYSGVNVKQESFEQTQKRIDDLRTLIKEIQLTPHLILTSGNTVTYQINLSATGIVGHLPVTDYLFRVGEEVTIQFFDSYTNQNISSVQGVTECTSDTYNTQLENPFSEHILYLKKAKPLRLFKGDLIDLVTDGNYIITHYRLKYIKQPATVSITTNISCDLPVHTHHEIVDICVAMLLENIESNRYQSFKQESLNNE